MGKTSITHACIHFIELSRFGWGGVEDKGLVEQAPLGLLSDNMEHTPEYE